MMNILVTLENSAFSNWLRESPSLLAYPAVLTLHTLGLAILVGASWMLDLRVLGVGRAIPLTALARIFRVMWIGFWINTISGVALFAADATGKGSTRLFLFKLLLIAAGVATIPLIRRSVFASAEPSITPRAQRLAVFSLAVWVAAIAAGRMMAYI
jgi:hypothetical protein